MNWIRIHPKLEVSRFVSFLSVPVKIPWYNPRPFRRVVTWCFKGKEGKRVLDNSTHLNPNWTDRKSLTRGRYLQWRPEVSVQRARRWKSWFLGDFLVLKCDPFFVKGGPSPPLIPPPGVLPPDPRWGQAPRPPSFPPNIVLGQKSAYSKGKCDVSD